MTLHLGDVPASSTLYIPFHTFDAGGASVTISGLAVTDIEIYKNGSTTQRTSDNGYALLDTDGIDFDSLTGIHGFSVDLSDNSDSGFYSVGGFYWVVVSSITVDGQTVSFVVATFRIVAAESVTGKPKVDVDAFGGTAGTFASGRPEVNTSHIAGSSVSTSAAQIGVNVVNAGGTAWGSGAITAASIANGAIDAATFAADVDAEILSYLVDDATRIDASALNTATGTTIPAIVADTNELQTDWANGGRLDLLIDAILEDTGTTLQAELDGIQADTEDLQAKLGTPSDFGSGTSTLAANLQDMADNGTATFDRSTDSLQAIRDRGDAAWITATGFSTHSAADVWAVGTRALTVLDEDSTTLDLDATIRAAVGLAAANLDTQIGDLPTNAELATALGTADDAVLAAIATTDGKVDGIKAKTDSLTFTVAGQVDSNIQYVNDVQVNGVGTAGSPWGP